jgi:Plavaka transposase
MQQTTLKFKNPKTGEEDIEYPMFARPIMDWMSDILGDKKLQGACCFDAVQIEQYDAHSGEFDRRYSEPWTGRSWWEIQVSDDIYLFWNEEYQHTL